MTAHCEVEEPPVRPPGAELVPGYEVVTLMRRGNRLDVYDAWSIRHHARCVVKVVRPDRVTESGKEAMLRREGELLRDLAHPHLVRVYEVVEAPQVAVVMETLTGLNLDHALDEHARLLPREAALLGAQLASALRYLHLHGYVHGDLSAGNVILQDGVAKLIDLSLSGPPGPVRAGTGTSGFRAPEQAAGGEQTPATDVWGLGAVLHLAVTGRTHDEMRLCDKWPGVRQVTIRKRLLALVRDCMRERPEERLTLEQAIDVLATVAPLREI